MKKVYEIVEYQKKYVEDFYIIFADFFYHFNIKGCNKSIMQLDVNNYEYEDGCLDIYVEQNLDSKYFKKKVRR